MTDTMDNLHIPPEVVEAAAIKLALSTGYTLDWWTRTKPEYGLQAEFRGKARTAIRAALAAWVECGMAKIVTEADDPNRTGRMSFVDDYPSIIIRTKEAI